MRCGPVAVGVLLGGSLYAGLSAQDGDGPLFAGQWTYVSETSAVNAESGTPVPLRAEGFVVPVPQRDFAPVLLVRRGAGSVGQAAKGE